MGTSSLYGGPKKTSLLPSDYNTEDDLSQNSSDQVTTGAGGDESSTNEKQDDEQNKENKISQQNNPELRWRTTRSSMRKAMQDRSRANIKSAIRNYTKSLGGHSNAARQASKARKSIGNIYGYFTGSPGAVRQRFVDAGIQFEGRPTKDVFHDICNLIAPVPNDIEDSLVNMALQETFSDIAADQSIDLNNLDVFNEELLQRLVGGMMKHYIFDKLLLQSEQTAYKKCDRTSDIVTLEKDIKEYIDGIVDSVVPSLIRNGLDSAHLNKALDTLFDITYQQMEEL